MKTNLPKLLAGLFLLASLASFAQAPRLSSYPASANVLFLDFDGHVVEGTSWNGSSAIVCNDANLSTQQIAGIFNRVAEDFRPFAINVTTDSTLYDAAPADRRMRVVLTTSSSWYGTAGGVAYMNSFTWGDNTPCFVFTALLNYNAKAIAEAASHEFGHTLGLRHQSAYDAVCNKTSEYNSGKGSGEIGWAPIMGVGYYQNMTLWNYGANPYGCNSYQDDLSVITRAQNGISFRPDDHGHLAPTATVITSPGNGFTASGIIEQPNDEDAVKFTIASQTRLQATILPYSIASGNTGANIDLEVELVNAADVVIGVYNPASTLDVAIDTALSPGTYYLRVRGKGNVYAPNYASLGSYTISASLINNNALPLHKLQLKGITTNRQHQLEWEIVADEKVTAQTIEVSTDGTRYVPAATVNGDTRAFRRQSAANLTYYRVAVVFDNGRQYYSNAVALRDNGSNNKPYLLGNTTTGTLRISSPAVYSYTVFDFSGRILTKGQLREGVNTVSLNLSTTGLYLIQFSNGQESFTEKFNKL
jgi:hypothetical protein